MSLPSIVELSARHTTILFSTLNSLNRQLPPLEQRPHGTDTFLSRINAPLPRDAKDLKAVKDKDLPDVRDLKC